MLPSSGCIDVVRRAVEDAVFRVKPSKPAGLISVVVAAVMLGIGIDKLGSAHGHARWFLIGWCALGVVIGGLNAWSVFSRRGFTWQMVRGPGQELVDSDGNRVAADGTSIGDRSRNSPRRAR